MTRESSGTKLEGATLVESTATLRSILSIAVETGGTCTELARAEARSVRTRWRQVFAKPLFVATGKWTLLGYDWHTFSYEHTPAIDGEKALSAYRTQRAVEVYLLPDGSGTSELGIRARFRETPLPDFGHRDVLVTPTDYEWTMAFTHEGGWLGPYFATAHAATEQAERAMGLQRPDTVRRRPR